MLSSKMVSRLAKMCLISVVLNMLVNPHTYAGIITKYKRSAEGLKEPENTRESVSDASAEQGTVISSQINNFQFLLPFWWHYLRPMLNVFATNTNVRQSLQKEYEYEIEQGHLNEIEPVKSETENEISSENIEGQEVETTDKHPEFTVSEQAEDVGTGLLFMNEETSQSNAENIMKSNIFNPFDTEHAINEQSKSEFPEFEASSSNMNSVEDTGKSEELGIVANAAMTFNNLNYERESSGENNNIEQPEEEQRRFALTGNIVGSFGNSLMELMPTLLENTEHESQSDAKTIEEIDISSPSKLEQSEGNRLETSEAFLNFGGTVSHFASPWDGNIEHNNIGSQEEDFWDQGAQFQPTDTDNTDNVVDSLPGQIFTSTFNLFGQTLQPMDQDSST